jgi:hypothetical protein
MSKFDILKMKLKEKKLFFQFFLQKLKFIVSKFFNNKIKIIDLFSRDL